MARKITVRTRIIQISQDGTTLTCDCINGCDGCHKEVKLQDGDELEFPNGMLYKHYKGASREETLFVEVMKVRVNNRLHQPPYSTGEAITIEEL